MLTTLTEKKIFISCDMFMYEYMVILCHFMLGFIGSNVIGHFPIELAGEYLSILFFFSVFLKWFEVCISLINVRYIIKYHNKSLTESEWKKINLNPIIIWIVYFIDFSLGIFYIIIFKPFHNEDCGIYSVSRYTCTGFEVIGTMNCFYALMLIAYHIYQWFQRRRQIRIHELLMKWKRREQVRDDNDNDNETKSLNFQEFPNYTEKLLKNNVETQ